jgi:NAD(P)-dependent dehydrogenase (short-subunit alcohol dehydrogenase family)
MKQIKPYAFITGVSGGIGSSLVQNFFESGYKVIGTDIIAPKSLHGIEYFFQLNLELLAEDEKFANNFYKKIHKITNKDGLNVLINNAAIQIVKPIEKLTLTDLNKTLNVNIGVPFLLTKIFLKDLVRAKGSVINISSIHSNQTKPNFAAYAASKAALSGLTRALSVELGERIRINAIEPAAIATEMLKAGFKHKSNKFKLLSKMHPVGRIGYPREVANLAVFLASSNAKFINGSVFEIDGGISNCLHDPI